MSKVVVMMTRPFKGLNPGETAGWDEDEAAHLVKQGAARVLGSPEDTKVVAAVADAKKASAKKP